MNQFKHIWIISLVILFTSTNSFAGPEEKKGALIEVGTTLLMPAVFNLNLGFWGTESFPLLLRASGMYWGMTRGIQGDLGWAFDRSGHFRQFIATTFSTFQIHSEQANEIRNLTATGIGATYGFNLYGFTLQAGYLRMINNPSASVTTNVSSGTTTVEQRSGGATLQIGYCVLF